MKDIILNRRSIRKFTDYKISQAEILEMIDLAQRAPSSGNFQPWRFFIIETNVAKEKLRQAMPGNQLQLDTSSQMILITADKHKHQMAETIYDRAVLAGYMPEEVRARQLARIKENPPNTDDPKYINGLFLDAGLVAMNLMLTARIHGYETNPIGGFNKDLVNDALGIDKRYIPVVLISIGKKDDDGYQSVRLNATETTTFIK